MALRICKTEDDCVELTPFQERMYRLKHKLHWWWFYWAVMTIRFFKARWRAFKEQKQTCKVCGQVQELEFYVPDEIWESVVPKKFAQTAMCLRCFDRFAKEAGVDYVDYIYSLEFAGDWKHIIFIDRQAS